MDDHLDDDLKKSNMSEMEKDGVQFYRNFTKAINKNQIEKFKQQVDETTYNTEALKSVVESIAKEDIRFIPVVTCAFVDDALDEMYKREIPQGVPGGRESLFGSYGPLSSLSKRIQLAYCFGWINLHVLSDIDAIRKIRNKMSHSWNHEPLSDYFLRPPISEFLKIEEFFGPHIKRLGFHGVERLNEQERYRVRLIWIVGVVFYECQLSPFASKNVNDSHAALYTENPPKLLTDVAAICSEGTRRVINTHNNSLRSYP